MQSHFKAGPSSCASIASAKPQWKQQTIENVKFGPDTKRGPTTNCTLQFPIPNNLKPPVLLYYRLTNFYQNHRRYVKSLDTDQLKGKAVPASTIKGGSCDPLKTDSDGKPYYPCGLIANSLFNDSFSEPVNVDVQSGSQPNMTYPMTNKGIAWSSDKALYGKTKYSVDEIAVPPNWVDRWPNGYTTDHPPPNLDEDEEFQVWMRTAGLPAFSKLARRNDDTVMNCSNYQIDIQMSRNFQIVIWLLAYIIRLSCHRIWRDQIDFNIYEDCHRGKESIPRDCIRRSRRPLHPSRRIVHSRTFDQAKVR